ncbi:MAG: ribosome small subunit-dependent GTPase A [Candidatus Aminicenantes bacterium]|nr:ribosome small subunit-dependent GTPase A [Candidatus Aminicenantes bacterium]
MDVTLARLGFSTWFEDNLRKNQGNPFVPARVTAVHKEAYLIRDEKGEYPAELSGRFLFNSDSSLEMPTAGDWVAVEIYNDHTLAVIHALYPRRTVLKRKSAGENAGLQLIAANIDTAFIMQTCSEDFNLRRLERYLVTVRDGGVEPVILLSKSDLVYSKIASGRMETVRSVEREADIFLFSNTTGDGLDAIRGRLQEGRTFCLLGSSGVGKTSLLNNLIGREAFFTKSIRPGDEKGRHATSRRQLVLLETGGILIDTPGMRELGVVGGEQGITSTFPEIAALIPSCRFTDCTHTGEEGCAVIAAVNEGRLDPDRYRSFLKLRKESAFNEMSYLERRKRDKAFGRMCKSVMSHRKKSRGEE